MVASLIIATGFVLLSIPLFMGKGAWFIAGYNTMSKKQKNRFDQKALCRGMAVESLVVASSAFMVAAGAYFSQPTWLTLGRATLIVSIPVCIILVNFTPLFKAKS